MASELDINGDDDLLHLLCAADPADVSILVDFLTDSGKGRLAMASEVSTALQSAKIKGRFSEGVLLLLIRELQHFGGNSVVNLFRRNGVPYVEIVADVLAYLGGVADKNESVASLETKVLNILLSEAWENMSAEEQANFARGFEGPAGLLAGSYAGLLAAIRQGGASSIKAVLMSSGPLGQLVTKGTTAVTAGFIVSRFASLMLGPVGLALTGAAGAKSLAGEAYRVTIPCVVQIACIRQKKTAFHCPSCQTVYAHTARFCSGCGTSLTS
ncbi:ubiquinol-cytochrome C chaperone family protein [Pseudomonas luteola]|uniref:ubiquinol-cytochrome C chaperone family protein n=1 Tax=Pseudomonas luteola TaxID=47886 RepID=UPI00289EE4AD|nr:ubiquinol-cytochrome C chaperone family protein [Pseudomonas luteola]